MAGEGGTNKMEKNEANAAVFKRNTRARQQGGGEWRNKPYVRRNSELRMRTPTKEMLVRVFSLRAEPRRYSLQGGKDSLYSC